MNVLVVDDSRSIRDLVGLIISEMQHQVFSVDCGAAAVELFANHTIDLVLLDVEMPGINGFETCRQLREIAGNNWIPVIFLSSRSDDKHFVDGIDAGGDAYLSKPVNSVVLQAMVRAMARISAMSNRLAQANKVLKNLVYVDALTNIVNRGGFDKAFENEWMKAIAEQTPICILLLDIDYFKLFNDNYGHPEGDRCLVRVAEELAASCLGPDDLVARYGGEEFVLLLPQSGLKRGVTLAKAIVRAIAALSITHDFSEIGNRVTLSIGVSCCILPHRDSTKQQLLKLADEALYAAKDTGRNRVCHRQF